MRTWLLDLLVCPECRGEFRLDATELLADAVSAGTLTCDAGHSFPIAGGVPRFVQHELNADQARTRDSFGYEWTRLYPEHGHQTAEWQAERDIFLEYTRTVPSDYRGKLVLDAGCGNGRYAKLANDWGSRVVAVDISSAVDIAQKNVGDRADVTRRPGRSVQAAVPARDVRCRLLHRRAAPHAGRQGRVPDASSRS